MLAFNEEWFLTVEAARRQARLPRVSAEFPLVFQLRGPWEVGLLDQTLQTLAARHSVFRTVYPPMDRCPSNIHQMLVQSSWRRRVVVPGLFARRTLSASEIAIEQRDAGSLSIDDLVAVAMAEPLAPDRPQIRAVVFHVDNNTRVLVLVTSHLVCDGWSIRVLVGDFMKIYRSTLECGEPDLLPINVCVEEFALSQQTAYASGAFAAEEAFWRRQWSELDEATIRRADIPFARFAESSAPPVLTGRTTWFSPATSAEIGAAARRLRVTPYILFRTAMTLALSATLGKRRVAFWANFANRSAGLEHTIGWCSNTHAVAIDVPENETVASVCRTVAAAIRDAQRHEALPLTALWQRMGVCLDRHDNRVNFDTWPMRPQKHSSPGPVQVLTSSFLSRVDLDLRLIDDGRCFGLRSTHDSTRYDDAGVAALVSMTAAIAERIAADPSETPSACSARAAADIDVQIVTRILVG